MEKHLAPLGFIYIFAAVFVSRSASVHSGLINIGVESYAQFIAMYAGQYFPAVFLLSILLSAQLYVVLEFYRYKKGLAGL